MKQEAPRIVPGYQQALVNLIPVTDLPHLLVAKRDYAVDAPPDGMAVPRGFGVNYVMAGRGIFRDTHGAEHPLRAGTVYFRCGKYPHTTLWERAEAVSEYFISFSRLTYEHLEALGMLHAMRPPVLQCGRRARIIDRFEGFLSTFAGAAPENGPQLLGEIIDFIRQLQNWGVTRPRETPHAELVRRVRARLDASTELEGNLPALAEEFGVSYSLLRKVFVQATGMSLRDYQLARRMGDARHLLETHTVKEVAARLGYADPFSFSKRFKQAMGISPKQFQQLYYSRAQ